MMLEDLRPYLYPLGILPSIFFTLRVLLQWYQSEKRKKSYVGKTFWRLSFTGNSLLMLHYFLQVQYPFCLLQTTNALISWRNLNLLKKKRTFSTKQVLWIFLLTLLIMTGLHIAQNMLIIGQIDWIRTPQKTWDSTREHHSFWWHCFGFLGATLFTSRFWIQWWHAEKKHASELNQTFWWISIAGSVISLIYFATIQDTISMINFSFGLVPYLRNIVLIRREKKLKQI